jgi:hypothetical protein
MGQYHKLVNLDKQEQVSPYAIGLLGKQFEHTGSPGGLSDALYLLTMISPESGGGDFPLTEASGRWAGDRVVVVGDYTQENAVPGYEGNTSELYYADWLDISDKVREAFSKIFEIAYEEETMFPGSFSRKLPEFWR